MALNNSSQVTLLRTADLLFAPSPDGDETELDGRASPLRKEKPPPTRYNYLLLLDSLHYARQWISSEMHGTRGHKRQRDIGVFNICAARNCYHHG